MNHNQENNFDFLRQFAAFLVILGHSESIVGSPHTGFWGVSISTLGIQIFFTVSGYLVTESWLRNADLKTFLAKRAKRIFPGLTVCICLTIFVLGPLMTTLTLHEYLTNSNTYLYLYNILLYPIYNLPGLFQKNTYPNAVNGSLWSLPVEFACYLGIVFFGAVSLAMRRSLSSHLFISTLMTVALLMTVTSQTILSTSRPIVFWGSPLRETFEIAPFFIAGTCLRLTSTKMLSRIEFAVPLTFLMALLMSNQPQYYWAISWIVTPYLVLSFGISRISALTCFGRWGDPSYGMYLYAFPAQQTLQYMTNNRITLFWMVLGTTSICLVLGYTSWHTIEKHFLRRSRTNKLSRS